MKEGKYVFYLIHFLSDQLMEFLAKNDDARRPPSVHAIHISRLKDRFTVFRRAKKNKVVQQQPSKPQFNLHFAL